MRVSAALCDFATVRDGLLTSVSAGVTRVYRPTLPAALGIWVAVVIDVEPTDVLLPHEARVSLRSPAGTAMATFVLAFQLDRTGTTADPDETLFVPVPVSLAGVQLQEYGTHTVSVEVDDQEWAKLTFKVLAQPPDRPTTSQVPQRRPH